MYLSIYVLLSEWLGLFISGFFNQLPCVLERIYVCRGFCVSTEVRIRVHVCMRMRIRMRIRMRMLFSLKLETNSKRGGGC